MRRAALVVLGALGCDAHEATVQGEAGKPDPRAAEVHQPPDSTIDAFFAAGRPSFVRGTQGGPVDDLRVAAQVDLVRSLLFPGAVVVDDVAPWPDHPVVYGARHINARVAGLGEELAIDVDEAGVRVGDTVLEGDDLRLIAVVPATDVHPSFVWYAGTGDAGVAEINAGVPTGHPLVVADRFGLLAVGRWVVHAGTLRPELGPLQRRIQYRTEARTLDGFGGQASATVTFGFPEMVAPQEGDSERVEAAMKGLEQVVRRLELDEPVSMTVYVYPDRASKVSLTGNGGDGHAVPSSRTLHVLALDPDATTSLVAHEGTHVLGYYGLGPPASPLMGEGMAVWVSGGYGGEPLDAWRGRVEPVALEELLGPAWANLPEQRKYPMAGAAFGAAVDAVGAAAVARHLLGATAERWAAACAGAGTTAEALESAYRGRLVP